MVTCASDSRGRRRRRGGRGARTRRVLYAHIAQSDQSLLPTYTYVLSRDRKGKKRRVPPQANHGSKVRPCDVSDGLMRPFRIPRSVAYSHQSQRRPAFPSQASVNYFRHRQLGRLKRIDVRTLNSNPSLRRWPRSTSACAPGLSKRSRV